MRIENGVLQAALACSLLSTGTLSFSIRGPSRRSSRQLLIRKARAKYGEDPEDEEQIHQAWLQSAERFSPEWLQKDIDKSKLPNPDGSVSQVNGGATGQQAPIGTTPINGSTGTVTSATPADKAASSTGPQMGMVEASLNQGKQPTPGGITPGQQPNDQSVDRFSPQWLQNPPVPGTPAGAMPNTAATAGQQQQQQPPPPSQGTTPGQPPQQPQQTAAPPPEDRFSPAWLKRPPEPAHGSNPGMPQDDRFSPEWMRQPFEDGMPPPPDGGPMMMPDDGPLRPDNKGAKDWTTPAGGAGQVAAAMGDDFAAFTMNQSGMPPGGMDPQAGMMPPPLGMQQGGGMMSQGGMMQPPPPGMQQGGFPDFGLQQGGMMQPPQPGITAFPSQPELLPQNPVSDQMAEDMVKQFEASMARLDGKAPPDRPDSKDVQKDEKKSEEKKKEPIIPPVSETREDTSSKTTPIDKQDKPAAILAKEGTKVNQTVASNATVSISDDKNTTVSSRAVKAAAVKQEETPRNVTCLVEHEELRRSWDKTPQKREAEKEEKRQKAELRRKYEETLAEVKRTYEEGLRKCTEAKLARFQQLDDEVPKTTDLAVGIARMGQALRKMKDSDEEKKKLEAELLIWQDQYDRTSEEESRRK